MRHYSRLPRDVQDSYYVTDVAKRYNFPDADGTGQCIALIELGGGYLESDIKAYADKLNLPPLDIVSISVDGATNQPGEDPGSDGEVALDIQMIYGLVPKARIVVYFAPNTDDGFANAIMAAVNDAVNKPSVISISWGGNEDDCSQTYLNKMESVLASAASKGITVVVASGDSGADDDPYLNKPVVDYPGSSLRVISCGGTQLLANDEVVWNNLQSGDGAGGGGMSKLFPLPQWQKKIGVNKAGRCVPDVCGNASPLSGYNTVVSGQWQPIGGTSAVAPIVGALVIKLNQILGKPLGYMNGLLYSLNVNSFYDVVIGNNGYWHSGKGYDLASGLGRLDGTHLVENIKYFLHGNKRDTIKKYNQLLHHLSSIIQEEHLETLQRMLYLYEH